MLRASRVLFTPLAAVEKGRIRRRGRARWTRNSSCKALMFDSFGQPEKVVQLRDHPLPELGSRDVSVEMLACPVNPSDINIIQGVYPIKPPLPGVGGGEGVGVVRERGEGVKEMDKGDWVIPALPASGTWRTRIVSSSDQFIKISSSIPLGVAATMTVNPPTAYRMLRDFIELKPGDCVIQNGGNSGVGVSVIQLAAAWGLHSVSIIRDRPNLEEMVKELKGLGASEVVTEDFASSHGMKDLLAQYQSPKLALNCVGGKSSTVLLKHLGENGVMINYGGMARQPVITPVVKGHIGCISFFSTLNSFASTLTGYLIFKNVKVVGYWNAKWIQNNLHSEHHHSMMRDLTQLAVAGQLTSPPVSWYPLHDYTTALEKAMKPFVGRKQIIKMDS